MTRQPFKDQFFNAAVIGDVAARFAAVHPPFAADAFRAEVMAELPALELSGRSTLVADALARHLPADFPTALPLVLQAMGADPGGPADATAGFRFMPLLELVGRQGLHHFDLSIAALREMTKRFSAEFAIRPFLRHDLHRTLAHLLDFAADPDPRVRRLASEGTRPRLPWSFQLTALVRDPSPTLPLLERLRDDPDPVVRRSVANHLNDIAKDHPELLLGLATRWSDGAPPERQALLRHALRTLVKKADPTALALLGAAPSQHLQVSELAVTTPTVPFGDAVEFTFTVTSTAPTPTQVVLTYAIHHLKADGRLAPKVFKLSTRTIAPGATLTLTRRHALRPITTRRYYPGAHAVEVFANGASSGTQPFTLLM